MKDRKALENVRLLWKRSGTGEHPVTVSTMRDGHLRCEIGGRYEAYVMTTDRGSSLGCVASLSCVQDSADVERYMNYLKVIRDVLWIAERSFGD